MNNEREARRRRIAERGSDRLALITGRLQNVQNQPAPDSSSTKHSYTQSSPALLFDNDQLTPKSSDETTRKSSDQSLVGHKGERIASDPQLHKCETNTAGIQDTDLVNKIHPRGTQKGPKASFEKQLLSKLFNRQIFTAKEINSCIIASESIRVKCSVAIAILVVLSKSSLASRPLYILLLANMGIVLKRLLEKGRISEKTEKVENHGGRGSADNWVEAVTILEVGVVFYQSIRAIFIDCSFYLAIVICGLSLF